MPIYQNLGEGWELAPRWVYRNEDELETFLIDNPNLIAGERDDVWTVWARQIAARSDNQLDLLGLGSDGSITIVECKLGSNREERREVIAQVLEYASALWEMDLERFRELFRKQHPSGRDPFELLVEQTPSDLAGGDWDVEQTKKLAALNLQRGSLRLVVAVDDISERLRRIIDYVNSRSPGELKIIAISIPRYGQGTTGVVAVETHGERAPAPGSRSAELVFPSLEQLLARAAPDMVPVVERLHRSLSAEPAGVGRLMSRASKQSISYEGRTGSGQALTLFRLWPASGSKKDARTSSQLDTYPKALETIGTSTEAVLAAASARGFESAGNGIRLRASDVGRLLELVDLLDREVVSRIDA